jgi:choline dehydrogenase-like flavoprotein
MLMATCYLGSQASAMTISLKRQGNHPVLSVKGETPPRTAATLKQAGKKLGRALSQYRAFRVPGSFTILPPGSDAHLAGTVPMGGTTRMACNAQCELVSAPGIYMIDGAWLPHLPPKHCTFIIMANAARVGLALSKS